MDSLLQDRRHSIRALWRMSRAIKLVLEATATRARPNPCRG